MLVDAFAIAGGLVPLAAMLSALFAAVWIRDAQREREAVAPAPDRY